MHLSCETAVKWRGATVYNRDMAITLRTFGERVTWLLKRPEHGNGMSQKELAAALHISSQYLSTLMSGRRGPNVRHLQAAAKALNTSVSFLALTTDDPSPDVTEAAPVYFSPEADTIAVLVDRMTGPQRALVLDLVEVIARHYGVGQMEDAPDAATAEGIDKLFDKAFGIGHVAQPTGSNRGVKR
jgi:transcriptional regulator with XRE-family HTH domain